MIFKKKSYSKVSSVAHDYIKDFQQVKNFDTQGEALNELVDSHKTMLALGIDEKMIAKLELLKEILSAGGSKVEMKEVLSIAVNTVMKKANIVNGLDTTDVLNSGSSLHGSARIRINHFVEMIKEHNSNSNYTLKITQTLIANGLGGGKASRNVDLDLIKCSDNSFFAKGTNSNRAAIKSAVLENGGFVEYNNSLSNLTTRAHNLATIKNLTL